MPALLNPFAVSGSTLLEMITVNGLSANLCLCLDSGDANSYDGTSQTWFDLSGGNQNFFRGSSSGAQASDPTFNGSAGAKSAEEYFSVDGGDYFSQVSSSLNFAETWHKDNAAFTFGFVMYVGSGDSVTAPIFNNDYVATLTNDAGTDIYINSGDDFKLDVARDTGGLVLNTVLLTDFSAGARAWRCGIISMTEATGNILVKTSSSAATLLTGKTYSSPSRSPSNKAYSLMGESDGANRFASGVRLACVFGFNRALPTGELDTLYAAIKGRFTTLG